MLYDRLYNVVAGRELRLEVIGPPSDAPANPYELNYRVIETQGKASFSLTREVGPDGSVSFLMSRL